MYIYIYILAVDGVIQHARRVPFGRQAEGVMPRDRTAV